MDPAGAKPELLPVAADMSQQTRENYERECLAELQNALRGRSESIDQFHKVKEARLVGGYPGTGLYVRWRDTRDDIERDREFKLWVNPVTGEPPGSFEYHGNDTVGREPPAQVSMLIWSWIGES